MSADIYVLPEDCLSNIVSLTSPQDVCRMSSVSTTFRSAAESDGVWDRFLPSDYQGIIARSDGSSPLIFATKKKLFLRLCDTPLLIDEGKKSLSLDKWSGKKSFMIAARGLTIIWGGTPSYWTWISIPESRFAEVAELRDVCWLEIRGKINTGMLSQRTKYAAYMVFKFTENTYGFQHQPVEVSIGTFGVEKSIVRTVYLDPDGELTRQYRIVPRRVGIFSRIRAHVLASAATVSREGDDRYPKQRKDGWLEIEMGEYFNEGGQDQELEMSLMEVKRGHWKSGLIIQGIEIRPKESK